MSQKQHSAPEEQNRHRQIFDMLRDSERAAQTAERIAQPQHLVLTDDTARTLQERAHASLRQRSLPLRSRGCGLRTLFTLR